MNIEIAYEDEFAEFAGVYRSDGEGGLIDEEYTDEQIEQMYSWIKKAVLKPEWVDGLFFWEAKFYFLCVVKNNKIFLRNLENFAY